LGDGYADYINSNRILSSDFDTRPVIATQALQSVASNYIENRIYNYKNFFGNINFEISFDAILKETKKWASGYLSLAAGIVLSVENWGHTIGHY
jgi:hypothetical protein